MAAEKKLGAAQVAAWKTESVKKLAEQMKGAKTVLLASIKGLPSGQFHAIKKQLRGKAEIAVGKKSIVLRALEATEKGALQNLKKEIGADIALLFSDMDAFALSGLLTESQSKMKAKVGDIAPEDLVIEPGPTDMLPGPAISELGAVGLQVAVEDGKIAIKAAHTVVKEGEEISANVADVLGKLNIEPMKVGFGPLAAYDAEADKVYVGIRIDKEGALEALREALGKALGFAVSKRVINSGTVGYFLAKAEAGAKAVEGKVQEEGSESEGKEDSSSESSSEGNNDKEEQPGSEEGAGGDDGENGGDAGAAEADKAEEKKEESDEGGKKDGD
ncbi:50S ribosomal protein L10 [Candidatus Pacearchaeota archaeon]|nr:50S ribosomal protein L10 [Candidatus Pacearchaeota archaeon]